MFRSTLLILVLAFAANADPIRKSENVTPTEEIFSVESVFGTTNTSNRTCEYDDECGHGKCVTRTSRSGNYTFCECDKNYVDHDGGICNYEQYDGVLAMCLTVIFGYLGVGYFIVAKGSSLYNGLGSLQLLLFILGGGMSTNSDDGSHKGIGWLMVVASFIWGVAIWIMIAMHKWEDGNGVLVGKL